MDPRLPNVSIANARTIARVKLGVPAQYAKKLSLSQIRNATTMSKKTNIMPPMEYREYKGKTYLIDPKSPLSIGEFVTFLTAKSVGAIAPVARKLKLVTEYVGKNELKTNIIKILQALHISEPIEVPRTIKKGGAIPIPANGNLPSNITNVNANRTGNANANRTGNGNANRTGNANANRTGNGNLNIGSKPSGVNMKGNLGRNSGRLNVGAKPSGVNMTGNLGRSGGGLNVGAKPSGVNMTGNLGRSGGGLNLNAKPSSLSLSGNLGRNSSTLRLNAKPSNVGLLSESFGEGTGPPLTLGTPSPSGVNLNNKTYSNKTSPLKLGAEPGLTLSGANNSSRGGNNNSGANNNSVSKQLESLQTAVNGNRSANITNVVNEEVGKNNVSKTLANLAKKVG